LRVHSTILNHTSTITNDIDKLRRIYNIPGVDASESPLFAWFDKRAHPKTPHLETHDNRGNHVGIVCPHTARFIPDTVAEGIKSFKV
jgi:hypothetical protein